MNTKINTFVYAFTKINAIIRHAFTKNLNATRKFNCVLCVGVNSDMHMVAVAATEFWLSIVGLGDIEIMHCNCCSKRHCDYCYIALEHFAVVNRVEHHTISVS